MTTRKYKLEKMIFGSTISYRHYCPICDDYTMTGNKQFVCDCGFDFNSEIDKVSIICSAKRKTVPYKIKKALLEKQNNKCYWCGKSFDTFIYRSSKVIKLKKHYDHIIPYSYLNCNPDNNWCIACHLCNHWKSSKIFKTENEIRNYILNKWETEINNYKIEIL